MDVLMNSPHRYVPGLLKFILGYEHTVVSPIRTDPSGEPWKMDRLNNFILLLILILLWLMKILGQQPYVLNIHRVTLSSSRGWRIYSSLFVCVFLILFFGLGLPLLRFKINERIIYGISSHMTKLHYYSKVAITVGVYLVKIVKAGESIKWGENLRRIYMKLNRLQFGSDSYRGDIMFFVGRTFMQIVSQSVTTVLRLNYITDGSDLVSSWIAIFVFTLPSLALSICGNEFTMLITCLAHGLGKLNINLRREIRNVNRWSNVSLSHMQRINVQVNACEKIGELNHLHSELYKVIQTMTQLNSSRIFMVVAFLFLNIIAELYFICDHVTRQAKGLPPRPDVLEVFGIIYFCLLSSELYFIIHGGQVLKESNEETALIVHKVNVFHLDERLKQTIEELSLRIRLNEMAVKPVHLFELDSSTLYQMAHAITTFLIILVQFKMSEDLEHTKRRLLVFHRDVVEDDDDV